MISPDFLAVLRCPLDPGRQARLEEADGALVCQRCRVKFPVKEGIPCVLVEEAELPQGCPGIKALPCQQASAPGSPNP
jgi:uncharacterized protein YbaR (Trm112 family)